MSRVNDLNIQIDGAGGYSFDYDAILLSVVHYSVNLLSSRLVNSAMCCVEVYSPLLGVNICKPQGCQARETEKAKVNPVLQALDRISV